MIVESNLHQMCKKEHCKYVYVYMNASLARRHHPAADAARLGEAKIGLAAWGGEGYHSLPEFSGDRQISPWFLANAKCVTGWRTAAGWVAEGSHSSRAKKTRIVTNMSRMLTSSIVLCVLCVFAGGFAPVVLAQTPPQTPPVRQPRPQGGAGLQVQNLSPELNQLLLNWSQESAKTQTLQGTHRRIVYDKVFMVEKRSTGAFYYEAPSKGRIDIQPDKDITPGQKIERVDPQTGKTVAYTLKHDRAERWICNGTDIWQVNEATKQVEIFPIPPDHQGQNIMDGPLPFLFGMPPAKAKRRYQLFLIHDPKLPPAYARLYVLPRLRVDAANWRSAEVILDKQQYLPRAVKLIDPTGNTETTYLFNDLKPNASDSRSWIATVFRGAPKDPFNPDLKGYQITVHKIEEKNQGPAKPMVPSVVNLPWTDAKARLEKLGCEVAIEKGQKATEQKLSYVVYDQKPGATAPLQKGLKVTLTVYDKMPPPTAGTVPSVVGMYWKDAGRKLEQAGYTVKYLPGQAAAAKEKIYEVYQQTPPAGQQLKPGSEVTLTVYNKMP